MSWLFIEPADVWLFRDGKAFDAGSDHHARSVFPPNPSTVQGALRSMLLMASGAPLPDFALGPTMAKHRVSRAISGVIGWPGEPPRFRLRGPFLARRRRDPQGKESYVRYFPLPADVVKLKKRDDGKGVIHQCLAPLRESPFGANWPGRGLLPLWARTCGVLEEVAECWVDERTLLSYLRGGGLPSDGVCAEKSLFVRENRFGVGLDSQTRRPREGLLYQVEFIRPRDGIGLLVEVDDSGLPEQISWPDAGLLSFGGESRAARVTVVQGYELAEQHGPVPGDTGERLRVYLATPARFDDAWTAADWSKWFSGPDLRLVAAAVKRIHPIGGVRVDAESQKGAFQKTMYRYVPAGSVFFLEADGPIRYSGMAVTDSEEDAVIGFGQVFLGAWDYA
ncbi:MAG: type III-B CRISPR module-associated protein Cmr3 [Bacillota bacterium]|nr:type III-B CRISPR module-associated protein Cmr3 [Bacillota bacterium]